MRPLHAFSLLAALLSAAEASAQVSAYAWTLKGNPGGSGQVVGDSLQVIGADNSSVTQSGHTTWLETTATVELNVTCTCHYQTTDDGFSDAPVYLVNGTPVLPSGTFTQFHIPTGTYDFSFNVPAGNSFGFGIYTTDGCCGPGLGQFTDFVAIPVNWTDVGGGLDPRPWFLANPHGIQSISGLGDADGDGVSDLVVEADGHALIDSGATGVTLLDVLAAGTTGGQVADAGDVDADGIPDFVLGLPGASNLDGRVQVRSGADGHVIFAYVPSTGSQDGFGKAVAGLGDVNGDGYDDVAASSPFALSGLGQVVVLGGPTGQVLRSISGAGGEKVLGRQLAALDDVDLDGVRDLAVLENENFLARVLVFSGATGVQISATGLEGDASVGTAGGLASAHDFDGDGRGDLAWRIAAAVSAPGKVSVYSGSSGASLWSWSQPSEKPSASSPVTVGDVNGDGKPDVVFSVDKLVQIYSGAGAHPLLQQIDPPGGLTSFRLSAFGDVDLDGAADLALSPWGDQLVVLHALDGNGPPHLQGLGNLTGGSPMSLVITKAKAAAPLTLVVGVAELGAPFKGGTLVPLPMLLLPAMTDANGVASFNATWPAGLSGPIFFWSQAWIVDSDGPHGLSATNGIMGSAP